uniref:Uncharacterized protein n=1 Tax=mine drainage metagenome TaxID=410659 RepID=E6QP67_9ZZZZ
MGTVFSSPGKQASQAASAVGGIDQNSINQIEGYTSGQQQALRGAISGVGQNPYFQTAQAMNPNAYAVNPNDRTVFSNAAPTGSVGSPGVTPSQNSANVLTGNTQNKNPNGYGNSPANPVSGGKPVGTGGGPRIPIGIGGSGGYHPGTPGNPLHPIAPRD